MVMLNKERSSKYHENYDLMNLIGYGLAKFNKEFIAEFGFESKNKFYEYIVSIGICDTIGAIKNRQDMLDPFFDNGRKGWHQKKHQYSIRKSYIDSLFENENCSSFSNIIKNIIKSEFNKDFPNISDISPITKSKFRRLQETGQEAELYFIHNYQSEPTFIDATIEDARMWGDGYDFQLKFLQKYYLVEVKGVKETNGALRFTEKEINAATEYRKSYYVAVISNLLLSPKMTIICDPIANINLMRTESSRLHIDYITPKLKW